jgi:uncharacterized membrane protein YqjE
MRPPRTGPDPQSTSPTAGDALRRAADALVRLVKEHLELARVELRKDLRRAGRDAVFALAGVPLVLVGWALLMVALALAIAPWVGAAGGFAIVAVLNLAAGGGVMWIFAKKLTGDDRPDMDETTRELQEDRRWLQRLRHARSSQSSMSGRVTPRQDVPAAPPP